MLTYSLWYISDKNCESLVSKGIFDILSTLLEVPIVEEVRTQNFERDPERKIWRTGESDNYLYSRLWE